MTGFSQVVGLCASDCGTLCVRPPSVYTLDIFSVQSQSKITMVHNQCNWNVGDDQPYIKELQQMDQYPSVISGFIFKLKYPTKKMYKLTNRSECHNGYTFGDGLVTSNIKVDIS